MNGWCIIPYFILYNNDFFFAPINFPLVSHYLLPYHTPILYMDPENVVPLPSIPMEVPNSKSQQTTITIVSHLPASTVRPLRSFTGFLGEEVIQFVIYGIIIGIIISIGLINIYGYLILINLVILELLVVILFVRFRFGQWPFFQLRNRKSTHLGFQLYARLVKREDLLSSELAPWEQYTLDYELDFPSLSRIFTDITDHLWPSDTVHLLRMALTSVINPTPVILSCLLKGLNSPVEATVLPQESYELETSSGILLRLPPYTQTVINHPIYEAPPHDTEFCCKFNAMDLEIIWSLNDSTPQHFIQWLLEEHKTVVCFSVMLEVGYIVTHQFQ